jgi:asparagine synthase (glutamine-hydrolysing)
MCGILGLIGPRSFDAEAFGRALDVMRSRGPDDRGIYEEPECLIGHRRLAILDLSPKGHQPMESHDGRYVMAFNGEVYNFRELRKGLEDEGIAFRSSSDTEVVLEIYARQGPDCLQQFRGMFALAIWDRLEKALFLARDRLGIKPLYVWPRPDGIGFASEIKALRALPGGPSGTEPEALVQFLAWGSVPTPLAITKGVESLRPATWLIWKGGSITRRTYWDFPGASDWPSGTGGHSPDNFLYKTRGEALEALRPLLREAVAYRCISDAPLGAFLSGGIDSSSVVALMREAGQKALHTFSISFPQTSLDEGPFAVKVAEQFHTRHTDVSVNAEMAEENLDAFFSAMDQPTCDGFNTFLVSKFAKQGGLTVSLSGLGGDELFAGYGHYRRILRSLPWLNAFPRLGRRAASLGASRLPPRFIKLEALSLLFSPNTRHETPDILSSLYYAARGLFMPSQIRALVHPDVLSQTALGSGDASSLLPAPFSSVSLLTSKFSRLHSLMAFELRRYMHDQLLRDSDVFGMANSLEIRVPLIDHRIVETIFQTAPEIIRGSPTAPSGPPKALLLDALPSPLPRLCTHRPKMGFTFPFDAWMKGPWRNLLEAQFCGSAPTVEWAPFRRDALSLLWRRYLQGNLHWSRPWAVFALGRFQAA